MHTSTIYILQEDFFYRLTVTIVLANESVVLSLKISLFRHLYLVQTVHIFLN